MRSEVIECDEKSQILTTMNLSAGQLIITGRFCVILAAISWINPQMQAFPEFIREHL